jgi:hypothetical protein
MMAGKTREVVAFDITPKTEVEATVTPVHERVVVLKPALPQTVRNTVSAASTTSRSEDDEVNTIVPPGGVGPLLVNVVNSGRRFTLNGEVLVAVVPCDDVVLHRGLTGSSSHTQAYQILDSEKGATSVVVVAARACWPDTVEVDTAHRVPPAQIGGFVPSVEVDIWAVGVADVLQTMRK